MFKVNLLIMEKINLIDKNCIVCKNENSKYKCPNCKSFYCSVKCFKEHKSKCEEADKSKYQINENNETDKINKPLNLDEDEDVILLEKKLNVLKTNKNIMTKIKNEKLMKILRQIDSAKYKKRTLEKIMEGDPEFKEFTIEILETLGFIQNNEFVIPDDN